MEHFKVHTEHRDKMTGEMYLKAIYYLSQEYQHPPRAIELEKYLGIAKATTSEMLNKLCGEGYLEYKSYRPILLTKKGLYKAQQISRKYKVIRDFLIKVLHVDSKKAVQEACELEHGFTDSTVKKLELYLKQIT